MSRPVRGARGGLTTRTVPLSGFVGRGTPHHTPAGFGSAGAFEELHKIAPALPFDLPNGQPIKDGRQLLPAVMKRRGPESSCCSWPALAVAVCACGLALSGNKSGEEGRDGHGGNEA